MFNLHRLDLKGKEIISQTLKEKKGLEKEFEEKRPRKQLREIQDIVSIYKRKWEQLRPSQSRQAMGE